MIIRQFSHFKIFYRLKLEMYRVMRKVAKNPINFSDSEKSAIALVYGLNSRLPIAALRCSIFGIIAVKGGENIFKGFRNRIFPI